VSLAHLVEGVLRPKRRREEVRLELEFRRYEVYEERIREVYRPKGLLAFATATKEYVKTL
jgi:hypothetical protein